MMPVHGPAEIWAVDSARKRVDKGNYVGQDFAGFESHRRVEGLGQGASADTRAVGADAAKPWI